LSPLPPGQLPAEPGVGNENRRCGNMSVRSKKAGKVQPTEGKNPFSQRIDGASALKIARILNREDRKVALAVRAQLREIARAIEIVEESLSRGGRLFYVGAGTSGRLGVLDASECPPTFGVSPRLVRGIMAGGRRALWRSVEGAEDDAEAGRQAIRRAGVEETDAVVGITASGRTPFVRGALGEARKRKARSILIACNPAPLIESLADLAIKPVVGPEVIAGSTRMKAGTATKMVLNMISTGAMIRTGRVYGNLMVDLRPSSEKLRGRAEGIVRSVLGCSRGRARKLLEEANGRAKVAIVMGKKNCPAREAERILKKEKGFLRGIL
jgi:N-acetylmuramic acid 6-phosphate etherase